MTCDRELSEILKKDNEEESLDESQDLLKDLEAVAKEAADTAALTPQNFGCGNLDRTRWMVKSREACGCECCERSIRRKKVDIVMHFAHLSMLHFNIIPMQIVRGEIWMCVVLLGVNFLEAIYFFFVISSRASSRVV